MNLAPNFSVQEVVLDLNKAGLSFLTHMKFPQAKQKFKKAQKIITQEVVLHDTYRLNQLAGITFNNLACYYKKTKKPLVALKYLKKALQVQVYKLNNWTSIASTHLNICAIYSYMDNHLQAANHADLAIDLLKKIKFQQNDQGQDAKSYWNILMLSNYNLAIERDHLKQFQAALNCYQKAKQIAKVSGKINAGIIMSCDEAISKLEPLINSLQKKIILNLKKRRETDEKGFNEFIRYNKRNFSVKKQNDQQMLDYLKKVSAYNQTPTTTKFRSGKVLQSSFDNLNNRYFRRSNQNVSSTSLKHTNINNLNANYNSLKSRSFNGKANQHQRVKTQVQVQNQQI